MNRLAAFVSSLTLLGCASVSRADVDDLRAQHEREKARLDAVRAEISRAEAEAAVARERAQFEQCRALSSELRAEVISAQADCARQHAEHNMCEANNSSRTAKGGIAGCLLGIGAAAVSAGAGIPLALAGCAGGAAAGYATNADCAPVTCDVDGGHLTTAALTRHGRSALPLCGGYLGVQTSQGLGGTRIDIVEPQSPAAASGLQAGDVLYHVDGTPTPATYALYQVLNEKPPGAIVTLSVARTQSPFVIRVQLGARDQRTSL